MKSKNISLVPLVLVTIAFALSLPLKAALADAWQGWPTPEKLLGQYSLIGIDWADQSPTNQYCPQYEGATANGCWQVVGDTGTAYSHSPTFYDTQEVGEDQCKGYTAWMNGPNTGHSYSNTAGPSLGSTWYDCSGYPVPDHRYCLKSYHRVQWGSTCNTASNCILENSYVMPVASGSNDTTSNPGC